MTTERTIRDVLTTIIVPLLMGAGIMFIFQQGMVNNLREELSQVQAQTEQDRLHKQVRHIEDDLNRRLVDMHNQIQQLHHQLDIERTANDRDLELYNKAAKTMFDELKELVRQAHVIDLQ